MPAASARPGPNGSRTARQLRTRAIAIYLKNRANPLPPQRKRALTPSAEETHPPQAYKRLRSNLGHYYTIPQTTPSAGPLFDRLPAELRVKIWEHAVGDQDFHIDRDDKDMGHRVCDAEDRRCRDCDVNQIPKQLFAVSTRKRSNKSLLPLALACKKIYAEAVHVLYTKNTFHFTNVWTFAFFRNSILPKHYASIRSVNLRFRFESRQLSYDDAAALTPPSAPVWPTSHMSWAATCRALHAMTGLRRLRIRIVMRSRRYTPDSDPLRVTLVPAFDGLKGLWLDEFTVAVPKGPLYFAVSTQALEAELSAAGHSCAVVAEAVRFY
ncbi:hypothetical protein K505DRAFT_399475 [Melanomma pulvis-pyrius CBS 109.77]|uniref:DUF7730 domain-containing protein n=1 Tax=Melanomma pulvis-pyrius CBS 109.77 TaxID=1314802 RepID=A0A6A6WQP0_9PLEO|nr:hypothetical protein K505DRAFT_399475 [Melanomma pulvis-pyrius CBS 109.77]